MVELFKWLRRLLRGKREVEKPRPTVTAEERRQRATEELARRARPRTPLKALRESNIRERNLKRRGISRRKPKAIHQDVSRFFKGTKTSTMYRKTIKRKIQPEED